MNEINEHLVAILPDINRAAAHVALEWADVVEPEDVGQGISVALLERPNVLAQVAALEPRQRRQYLFRIGQQVASEERVDYEHFSGQYRYSTDEVRSHLDGGALEGVGEEPQDPVDGANAATFSVEDLDIRVAIRRLPEAQQRTLIERFALGRITEDRKAVTRAVDALTRELNRTFRRMAEAHDGPGSRQAVSNATAQVLTKRQENYG